MTRGIASMEFLFEAFIQIFGELLLQLLVELLVEIGVHSLSGSRRPINPILSTLGILACGAAAGGLSLLILPNSLIVDPNLRLANLFLTPVLLGAVMMLIGGIRKRKGQELVRLDRFGFAFAFASAMAFVRFIWAV